MTRTLKHFKYEIIKIVIFLILFGLSIVYVFSEQDDYYHHGKKQNSQVKSPVQGESD
jgi:hypothetical protein